MPAPAPAAARSPVLLKTLVFRSIFRRALADAVEPVSLGDDLRRRQRKKTPARMSATPTSEPTTAPAMVPPETLCLRVASWVSAPGFTTIGVEVTVCVTGAPDIVRTWVLTTVVRVHDEPDVGAATAASLVDVRVKEVVDELVDVVEVELVVVDDGVDDCDCGSATIHHDQRAIICQMM